MDIRMTFSSCPTVEKLSNNNRSLKSSMSSPVYLQTDDIWWLTLQSRASSVME